MPHKGFFQVWVLPTQKRLILCVWGQDMPGLKGKRRHGILTPKKGSLGVVAWERRLVLAACTTEELPLVIVLGWVAHPRGVGKWTGGLGCHRAWPTQHWLMWTQLVRGSAA